MEFFVFSMVEPSTFQRYCTTKQMPAMRYGDDGWIVASTGKPVPSLRMTPTIKCGTGWEGRWRRPALLGR